MKRSVEVKWDDPAQLAQAGRSMAGIEFLRAIRDGRLPHPPICALLGYRLTEVAPGHAVFEITAGETQVPAGGGYTTLEAKTNLVRPITSETGPLRAIGKVVHAGKRVATAEARLEDPSGKLYAHASSTCIVL